MTIARKQQLRYTAAALFLALSPGSAVAPTSVPDGERPPNVLFVAIDDLNDWVGCLDGHPDARTPNLDRLAERGTLFTRAYCPAPACNPSRVGVMTGLHPSTTGIYENTQFFRDALPNVVTLPQHFTAQGYRSVGGGKIYHGQWPDPASWEDYFPSMEKARPNGVRPEGRPLNGIKELKKFDWAGLDIADEEMSDHKVVDWAIRELAREHDQPFFLAVGIYRPHLPWFVPREYMDAFPAEDVRLPDVKRNDLADVPAVARAMAHKGSKDEHAIILKHGAWKDAVAAYLASIHFADAQLGRLMDALDASAHKENTILVVWSDHGWHLGEKEHWRKFTLWEEAARVPLLLAGPGVAAGATCERTVNLIDLYPTLIELCDLPSRERLDGNSLVPLLQDASRPWEHPSVTSLGAANHSVRTERWRYTRYSDGGAELYDHATDPNEWVNLAKRPELAEVVSELTRALPRARRASAPKTPPKRDR